MQAEKVVRSPAGVDSELQVVTHIFYGKGLYASLLTIYLNPFLLCLVSLFVGGSVAEWLERRICNP